MYFIKIATQKALLVIHSKNFKIGFCILLVGIILAGYFGYASIPKVQVDQKNLSEKYDELAFQHVYSLTEFEGLPHNSSIILSQLTDLQIKYDNLTFKYNTLQAGQSTLESQYHILQSQYSSLQTEYLNFLAEYQKLQPVTDFSYLVFTDGEGNYYAENGTTRVVDYSGTSGSQVGQFCIDALNVSGGKIVFVGEIALESPLEIQKGTSTGLMEISGLGPSTQLIVGQSSDGIRIVGEHAFGYGGPYHVVIKDLVLTTETFPEGKFMNYGIYIKNWFGVDVENVMVFYANKSGILIEDSADIQLDNVYVEGGTGTEYGGIEALDGVGFCLKGSKDCYLNNCFSDTNDIGFLIESNTKTNNIPKNVFMMQCEATLSHQKGILISHGDGIGVSNSLVEGTNSDGIMIIDSRNIHLTDSIVVGNVGNGIVITTQGVNMTQCLILIKGCIVNSNNKNGIGIWAKNGNQISHINIAGCTITNSGSGSRGNPDQPEFWDGINISNDPTTGGNCRLIKIFGCFIGNRIGVTCTQKYGIRSLENSDCIQVFYNDFFQNIAANHSLVGLQNSIGENGVSRLEN